jgi:hypothetical protein
VIPHDQRDNLPPPAPTNPRQAGQRPIRASDQSGKDNHVAALLHPLPRPPRRRDDAYDEAREQVEQEREETAGQLRTAWEETGADPVLSTLAGLRRRQVEIEATIRALLAYAREYAHPRPYTLVDLADAAGMSFSGVRTAYHDDEVAEVAVRTGMRPPRRRREPDTARQGSGKGHP